MVLCSILCFKYFSNQLKLRAVETSTLELIYYPQNWATMQRLNPKICDLQHEPILIEIVMRDCQWLVARWEEAGWKARS